MRRPLLSPLCRLLRDQNEARVGGIDYAMESNMKRKESKQKHISFPIGVLFVLIHVSVNLPLSFQVIYSPIFCR